MGRKFIKQQIPEYANKILSLGPNLALEINNPRFIPTNDILANIKVGIGHLQNNKK